MKSYLGDATTIEVVGSGAMEVLLDHLFAALYQEMRSDPPFETAMKEMMRFADEALEEGTEGPQRLAFYLRLLVEAYKLSLRQRFSSPDGGEASDGGEADAEIVFTVTTVVSEVAYWYKEALKKYGKDGRFPAANQFRILDRSADAVLFGWMTPRWAKEFLQGSIAESDNTNELWNKIEGVVTSFPKSRLPSKVAVRVVPRLLALERAHRHLRMAEQRPRSEGKKRKDAVQQAEAEIEKFALQLEQMAASDPAVKDFLAGQVVMEENVEALFFRSGRLSFVMELKNHAPQAVLKGETDEAQIKLAVSLLGHPDLRVIDATVDYLLHKPAGPLRRAAVDFLKAPEFIQAPPLSRRSDGWLERWIASQRSQFKRGEVVPNMQFKWFLYAAPYPLWKSVMGHLIRLGKGKEGKRGFILITATREEMVAFLPALRSYLDQLVRRPLSQVDPQVKKETIYFSLLTPPQEDLARYKLVKGAILALEGHVSADGGGKTVAERRTELAEVRLKIAQLPRDYDPRKLAELEGEMRRLLARIALKEKLEAHKKSSDGGARSHWVIPAAHPETVETPLHSFRYP